MAEPATRMPNQLPTTRRTGWWAKARATVRKLGPAGPWLLVATAGPLLGLAALTATHESWLPWFGSGLDAVLLFWAVAAVLAAICLVPTQVTSLLAGYLFGALVGTAVGMLVVMVAAAIGFGLWSRVLGSQVLDAIARSAKAERVHRALLGRGFWRTTWLIALLRLSPVMPFAATNLVMAAFGVRIWSFLVASTIGVAPRSIAVSLIGAELSELDWRTGGSTWSTAIAVLATVAVIVIISRLARQALRHETMAP
jgi:uncharacterized membrane protein YdjX (TVP38/TMEM64 family)